MTRTSLVLRSSSAVSFEPPLGDGAVRAGRKMIRFYDSGADRTVVENEMMMILGGMGTVLQSFLIHSCTFFVCCTTMLQTRDTAGPRSLRAKIYF